MGSRSFTDKKDDKRDKKDKKGDDKTSEFSKISFLGQFRLQLHVQTAAEGEQQT